MTKQPTQFHSTTIGGVAVTVLHVRGRRYAVQAKGKLQGYMLARTPVDAVNRVESAGAFAEFCERLQKVDSYLAAKAKAKKAK